jgi:predicted O-methyltransferase YrrM
MGLYSQAEKLDQYLVEHSSGEDPLLKELCRHTYLHEVNPRMLSGHILGSFLTMFSRMVLPSRILEVGTFTGYSSICLAKGLKKGGSLITIEINEELRDTALSFFIKAGISQRVTLINGDALEVIPSLNGSFELVFMDANKDQYPAYYSLLLEKVSPGGFIIADNVLWDGKVLDETGNNHTTAQVHRFNKMVTDDPRVENYLFPIRDGIMVIKKL